MGLGPLRREDTRARERAPPAPQRKTRYDAQFKVAFQAIRELMAPAPIPRRRVECATERASPLSRAPRCKRRYPWHASKELPMLLIDRCRPLTLLVLAVLLFAEPSAAQKPPAKYPALPSETPAKLEPTTDGFDYVKRDVMIPI